MAALLTLAEAKAHLRRGAEATADDVKIQAMVDSATVTVERHTAMVFEDREVTEYHYAAHGVVWLRKVPVTGVTSVQSRDAALSWPVGSLLVDNDTGRVTDNVESLVGDLTVVYEAGQAVPSNVKEATKEIVRWLWESQGPGRNLDARFGTEDSLPTGYGWADIPNRAKVLLGESVSGVA